MFKIDDEMTIHLTRGDACTIGVSANNGDEAYTFVEGDLVRLQVTEKNACNCVVLTKDVVAEADTSVVDLSLGGDETRIGGTINKPVDYWYEVQLNPETNPQTIIGYDEYGAKLFRLYPEGGGEA